jgi:phosphoribosylformylglycinamidine synthase
MYVDGNLSGPFGERHKISGLPTLQFTAVSVVEDVRLCQTMDFKDSGDSIYVLGLTKDEMGGSEYYDFMGYLGLNVPRTDPSGNLDLYRAVTRANRQGLLASIHGIYRGGLGVHLVLASLAGGRGAFIDLDRLPIDGVLEPQQRLFSESTGRFLVTVQPRNREKFEAVFSGLPVAALGKVRADGIILIRSEGKDILRVEGQLLRAAFQRPFGQLI